jgi:serine/threonine-protein kinase
VVVAGYRIEKVLGSGGMGTVYLAANPVLPRRDALKVLSSELSHDPPFRARFIREADLAATLDHPNIVTVYTRGETEEGQLWIAMQYVPGSDAHAELEDGRITVQRSVHIIGEVAKALDYAHRRNLVHRDVKPANFLLAPEDERVMLADFGIARALDDTTQLTATGMVMATVAYAAPETLGSGRVDGRADIYALGCSLYRMLTNQAPFASSGGIAATMAAHLAKPPPRVTDRVDLPRAIDAVIAKAMAKNPDERFQRARELAEAAAGALEGGITVPVNRPAPHPQPPPGWAPQQGPAAPPTRLGELNSYPSGFFSGPQPNQGGRPPSLSHTPPGVPQHFPPPRPPDVRPRESAHPPHRPRRRAAWIAAAICAVLLVAGGTIAALTLRHNSKPGFRPQTFVHAHGTTQISSEPHVVAALGPGDGDAALSLGVQPAVLTAPDGHLPGWEQQLVTANPKVLSGVDVAAVGAIKPDVIIATGNLDEATYNSLSAVAPTVTRPSDKTGPAWTWQDQVVWIGRILGRDDKAKSLVDTSNAQQSAIRDQHPAFNGKTIASVNVSDNGVTATLQESPLTDYLQGLGFRYSADLRRAGSDSGDTRPVTAATDFYQVEKADVLVVVRTDKAAGGGGYNGLPTELTIYRGAMVIADDPNVIAALNTGAYDATEFLNSNFVGALAQQVH